MHVSSLISNFAEFLEKSTMNEKILKSLKSTETEDIFDLYIVRPICYYLAEFFNKFGIHPNTVTIWSMVFGAASCFFFAHGSYHYESWAGLLLNLVGILLLMVGDILDCTDGQLARISGKKSRMGRILDGVAGFAWFTPIYLALIWRFYQHHDIEFGWLGIEDTPTNAIIATIVVFALAAYSGLHGLAGQQRLADYYIQVHLFFQKGEKGCELDNSERQQEILDQMPKDAPFVERLFQQQYVEYTKKQERVTPQFQRLMAVLKKKFGACDQIPRDVRAQLHACSKPLVKCVGLIVFNFRSAFLFLFCLLDVPVLNFLWEIIGLGLIAWWINRRHEAFCKEMVEKLS